MRARQAEEKTEEELPVPGQPPRDTVRAGGAAWLLLGGLLSATAEGEKKTKRFAAAPRLGAQHLPAIPPPRPRWRRSRMRSRGRAVRGGGWLRGGASIDPAPLGGEGLGLRQPRLEG